MIKWTLNFYKIFTICACWMSQIVVLKGYWCDTMLATQYANNIYNQMWISQQFKSISIKYFIYPSTATFTILK